MQERATTAPDVQSAWKEFTSPDGRKYYYNKTTKESRWTAPEGFKKPNDAPPPAAPVQVSAPLCSEHCTLLAVTLKRLTSCTFQLHHTAVPVAPCCMFYLRHTRTAQSQ